MSRNLSWTLLLLVHCVVGLVFAVAAATSFSLTCFPTDDSATTVGIGALLVFLLFNFPLAWSTYKAYPGFLRACEDAALVIALYFLMPLGAAIGGVIAQDAFGVDPVSGWLIGALVLSPFSLLWLYWLSGNEPLAGNDPDHIRGAKLLSLEEAQRAADALPSEANEPRIYWAGLTLPERYSASHFVILGPTGSGKTVTLRLLMQSVLPHIRRGSDSRAVIYDPKNEFLPLLSGMPLQCPVITLHPYDERGSAWDIARDITDCSIAQSLAATFAPSPNGDNKFFYMAAQAILSAMMEAFIVLLPERWTLRDVLLVARNGETLRQLLTSVPQTRPTYRQFFEDLPSDTLGEVRATLATETHRLQPVAALWDRAKLKVSLKEWAKDNYILVMGTDKEIATPLDNINRVLFQRISQLFTKQGTGRTWVFVDEAKFAGKIPGLDDLMTTGRSFGARVCVAAQDLSGLRGAWGEEEAHEILGGAGNKALLGTWNPYTAKYGAEVLGKSERIERTRSYTRGNDSTTTVNEHVVQRDLVMPDELIDVALADQNRFFGYYVAPAVGRYRGWLYHGQAMYGKGSERAFLPRFKGDQYLRPWDSSDRERFGPHLSELLLPSMAAKEQEPSGRTHLDDALIG